MANFFETQCKAYAPQWEEVSTREFTKEEQDFMVSAVVHQGTYDRSVMFLGANGKKYFIPIEKSSVTKYLSEMEPGKSLDMKRMILVVMKYIGNDPKYTVQQTSKIRYTDAPDVVTVIDPNNPFGL